MSNHSSIPSDELPKEFNKVFSGQVESKLHKFMTEEAKLNKFGETSNFPEGSLVRGDEGEIQFGIVNYQGIVIVNFGKPVAWFGMTAEQARDIAKSLIENADKINPI